MNLYGILLIFEKKCFNEAHILFFFFQLFNDYDVY